MAGRLVRVLSLRTRERETAPLSLHHIAGIKNLLGDVPSRSFGYKKDWHFTCDKQFLTFFKNSFPLPKQQRWRLFQLSQNTVLSVLIELRMLDTQMDVWRQLKSNVTIIGQSGDNGAPSLKSIQNCTTLHTSGSSEKQQILQDMSVTEQLTEKSRLESAKLAKHLATSTRPSRWTQTGSPSSEIKGNTSTT